MPDIQQQDYELLKQMPALESVHFEHIVDEDWLLELQATLPDVAFDAPHLRTVNE